MAQTTHPRKMTVGLLGQLDDDSMLKDVKSYVHGTDVDLDGTAEIAFGTLAALDVTSGECLKLAAQADVIAGVVVRSDAYDIPNELGAVGLTEGTVVGCLTRGRIRVKLEETVAVGDAVRYRAVATTGETPGAFRTSDPTGTDTVLITAGARWVEGGTTTTGAVLEFDILAMAFSADS